MVYFACRTPASTRRMLAVVGTVSVTVAALMVMLMIDLALAGASAGQQERRDVQGTVSVPFGTSSDPVSCNLPVDVALAVLGREATAACPSGPLGEFSDVAAGATVEVRDRGGALLGSSQLTGGVADGGSVTFDFVVEDVPVVDGYRFRVNARGDLRVGRQAVAEGDPVVLDLR